MAFIDTGVPRNGTWRIYEEVNRLHRPIQNGTIVLVLTKTVLPSCCRAREYLAHRRG